MEKKIITKCPFPLIKLNVNIEYAEVQKPSGVGYIILVLIKDAKERSEKLANVLKRFGIHEDLQPIFADEIDVLLNRGILRLARNNYYQREYFEEYTIGSFDFTANGERMFREGAIPTGEKNKKQIAVYYNPLTFEFAYNSPTAFMSMDKSNCFPQGFMERVETDFTKLKNFIIDNPKGAGLQAAERLLECDIASREDLFTKIEDNCEFCIDEDGIEVALKTAGASDFYEKYFTPDMLEREFDAKAKFKFDVPTATVKGFGSFKKVSAIYLPEDYKAQFDRPAKLLLKRDGDKISVKRGNTVTMFESGKIITGMVCAINSDWSFVTIDGKEMRYYTAARVTLTERILDKPISLNLLVEQTFGTDEKAKVIKAIYGECMMAAFTTEHANIIKAVYELTADADGIAQYIDAKIRVAGDRAKAVEILLAANGIFASIAEWQTEAERYANEIYSGLIADLTKENAGLTVRTARMLAGLRNMDKTELLNAVAGKFERLDAVALFNLLTGVGFTENDALSVANAVKIYVDKILADDTTFEKSGLSDGFSALASNLSDLNENLGIKSTSKYAFREGYKIDKFVEDFRAYKAKLDGLKRYSDFARDGFAELRKYEEIMQPVFDYIMIERNATQNPEKISEGYIRGKINAGDWRAAIGDMVIRLDYILGKRLGLKKGDGGADVFDKIDRARKENIIAGAAADTFHELRKFRNRLQHPTDEQLTFDPAKIKVWADAVFAVEESPNGGKN
jgi:hypothetical protein